MAFSLPFALVATEVCDISKFGTPEVLSNGLRNINVQVSCNNMYVSIYVMSIIALNYS